MRNPWMLRGGLLALAALLCSAEASYAEALELISASEVFATYTYPDGGSPGVLTLDDQGIVLIGTLVGGVTFPAFPVVDVTLSLELTQEAGVPSDTLAHGVFGGGVLSMVDDSGGPPVAVLEAGISGFELIESGQDNGSFLGIGAFTGATYGGDFAVVTQPTSGQINTGLITWFTDPALTNAINIDDFVTPPSVGITTLYGSMNQLNLLPEPTTMMLVAAGGICLLRRSRAHR